MARVDTRFAIPRVKMFRQVRFCNPDCISAQGINRQSDSREELERVTNIIAARFFPKRMLGIR